MNANIKAGGRIIRSENEWRTLITRFNASAMSPGAFCQAEKLSASAFYKWRGRFNEATSTSNEKTQGPAHFVDLGAINTTQKSIARLELKIDLGDGIVFSLVRN